MNLTWYINQFVCVASLLPISTCCCCYIASTNSTSLFGQKHYKIVAIVFCSTQIAVSYSKCLFRLLFGISLYVKFVHSQHNSTAVIQRSVWITSSLHIDKKRQFFVWILKFSIAYTRALNWPNIYILGVFLFYEIWNFNRNQSVLCSFSWFHAGKKVSGTSDNIWWRRKRPIGESLQKSIFSKNMHFFPNIITLVQIFRWIFLL